MSLKFNDANSNFEGETPKDIISALFLQSALGTRTDFESWWAYQARLLQDRHDIVVPHHETPGAHEALLNSLVKIGRLDIGPIPPKDNSGVANGPP